MKIQYLFTERAHLMCPNMYFGIAACLNAAYDNNKIKSTIESLSDAHPFLKALLGYEKNTNQYFYNITDTNQITWIPIEQEWNGLEDPDIMKQYQKATRNDWNLFTEGMLKMYTWKAKEQVGVLFVFHHLLADGRGGLGLVKEFSELYVNGKKPLYVEESLIQQNSDLPKSSELKGISKWLIWRSNKKWRKEQHLLSYEDYHTFADVFLKKDLVIHTIQILPENELSSIQKKCHQNKVSINDYLMAKMYLEEHINKIIIASDIRKQLPCYQDGALGNYSTAFSVNYKGKRKDVFEAAKKVHSLVQRVLENNSSLYLTLACYGIMEPGLLDAAAVSALGGFHSEAGAFVGGIMFGYQKRSGYSITNLGKISSTAIGQAMFIPPASPAIKKIQGVLTVNGTMTICSSERE
ncbi:condensation domain-containing protein [[Clostridium] polysaccharolyticum]|uniref:Condensation domain-containing protein n=1 Tax=[Clostridium] polysaccharolyticum TaxID=29364 RepID=A0A1I0CK83_9FIRM|nr:condensation domain-containing protein [[Clostridium] polysaccharolyticum]SET20057.1 Condensation domain-containing protein [[Clostridium] polysaccharolyticum]